ncbi:MAG: hypothetical protein C0510_03630 [Erythrobacter sp.]|nr:hypothetical protein [Erythrobacter sp.]
MTKATGISRRARSAKPRNKTTRITPRQREAEGEGLLSKHWRTYFLQTLAATSNVSAAALAAGVSVSRAYKARREHPDFARQWRAALLEGYEHLEMEVLGYLRDPNPERKMDVANALRLLAAHKETIASERAVRANVSAAEVRASIDRKVEALRQQVSSDRARRADGSM